MAKQHGLWMESIKRGSPFSEGRARYAITTTESEREDAYLTGAVVTENIFTRVEFPLTQDEVADFNALEARIAARLANEIATKGR